jgi:hypothetical protein
VEEIAGSTPKGEEIIPICWELILKLIAGFVDLSGGPVNTYKAVIISPVRQYSVFLRVAKISIGCIRKRFSAEISNP